LSALSGSDGFRLDGAAAFDYSGRSMAAAGDINGDGIDDLIVGAPYANPNGNSNAGSSYVVFGKNTPFAATLALSAFNGSDGFRLDGVAAIDLSGFSVAAAGDINGDGIDDLIVGAPYANPNGNQSGSSYVVFGKTTPFAATLALSGLSGGDGFRLDGVASNDHSGFSVAAAGDINGDGIDDLIVGASDADPNGNTDAGSSYVVLGKTTPFAATLALSALSGGDGFRLDGATAGDGSGRSVAAAGDINGDGLDDLIVGAYGADPNGNSRAGSSYVVFGKNTPFAATLALSALSGSDGFRLDGAAAFDNSGISVAAAGDINGDGIGDIIVGAFFADPNGNSYAGSSYVVFGKTTPFAATLALSALSGSDGFRLDGAAAGDQSGVSVAAAGDINGDGIDDLIVGAFTADPNGNGNAGSSYVLFGRAAGAPALSLNPLSLSFGNVPVSQTSAAQTVTLSNTGTANLSVGMLALSGANAGEFALSADTCSFQVIDPAASCTFDVTLTPAAPGARTAQVDIPSDAPSSPDALPVSGTGVQAQIALSPDPLAFGNVLVGSTSAVQSLTVANPGSAPLNVSAISAAAAPFTLTGGTCGAVPFAVAAAGSCTLDYTFSPTATGAANQLITLTSDAPPASDNQFSLQGSGVAPGIGISPASLAFGNVLVGQTSAAQTVTLSNTGTANLTLGTLALSGANAADFALSADTCTAQVIVPAASCTFDVSLTPAATGARAAQVDIPSDAPSSPDALPVSGTGVQPVLSLDTAALNFGTLPAGGSASATVTVSNNGSGDLTITAITAPAAPFAITGGSCTGVPVTLTPAASCTIDVSFAPGGAVGVFNGSFDIQSNAPSSPDTVSLSGAVAAVAVPGLNGWGLGLLAVLLGWFGWRRGAM
ncbi:MAG: IPTL-CTERM sorting domain-containing protein, partial [Lysobacterales bacterium]